MNGRWATSVVSSFCLAFFLALPTVSHRFVFWICGIPGRFADTMFHELGHAVFAWVFGYPAIPAILTVIGSEQASGFTLFHEHRWPVQILVWGLMAYGCWWLRREQQYPLSWVAIAATILLIALGFWPDNRVIIDYMGHGGSIFVGGIFLYRGLLFLESRHEWQRWLHLFFGWSMLLNNFFFAWMLSFDAYWLGRYNTINIAGNSADFTAMHEMFPSLEVQHIAMATLVYVVAVFVVTGWLAYIRRYDYDDYS